MKVRFFNIDWDTDGEKVDLPLEVIIPDVETDVDIENEGADILSDKYGWCVNSFSYEYEIFPENS